MLKKFNKIIRIIKSKSKYKNVLYIGAPSILKFLGITTVPMSKGYYSQAGQDSFVFNEFYKYMQMPSFQKTFIDIGCNHPTIHSNSHFFEKDQLFSVLAIDALSEVGAAWRKLRPNAQFVECAVGKESGVVSFEVVEGSDIDSMFSSVSGSSQKNLYARRTKRTVNIRTLSEIFSTMNIQSAGIVSMDIEGHEYEALKGINFKHFHASIFVIENNADAGLGRDNIRDLMISQGYVYYARIWNMDDIFIRSDWLK